MGPGVAKRSAGRTTKAAVVQGAGAPFALADVQIAEPRGHDVLVRIDAVGMCHADLGARDGDFPVPLPAVLGHEGAGAVAALGPQARGLSVGDRVVVTFDSCGVCPACASGVPSQCVHMLTLNFAGGPTDRRQHLTVGEDKINGSFFGQSSFAGFALASTRNVVRVSTDLPAHLLAPLGCGVQTGVGAVVRVLRPRPGDRVVIWGLGAVGLSALMAAARQDLGQLVAVDTNPVRLALARELGATAVVDASAGDAETAVRDLTQGGASGAVECSGSVEAFSAAIASCATGGTTVVVGAPPFGRRAAVDVADIVNGSKLVRGSVEGDSLPARDIPALVTMLDLGVLPLERFVSTFAFADINSAAEAMQNGAVVKPVLLLE